MKAMIKNNRSGKKAMCGKKRTEKICRETSSKTETQRYLEALFTADHEEFFNRLAGEEGFYGNFLNQIISLNGDNGANG